MDYNQPAVAQAHMMPDFTPAVVELSAVVVHGGGNEDSEFEVDCNTKNEGACVY